MNSKHLIVSGVPYREVDERICPAELQLHGRVFVVGGVVVTGPRRGDALRLTQVPVRLKDLAQVFCQTATVVHHCTQLLHLLTQQSHRERDYENTTMLVEAQIRP